MRVARARRRSHAMPSGRWSIFPVAVFCSSPEGDVDAAASRRACRLPRRIKTFARTLIVGSFALLGVRFRKRTEDGTRPAHPVEGPEPALRGRPARPGRVRRGASAAGRCHWRVGQRDGRKATRWTLEPTAIRRAIPVSTRRSRRTRTMPDVMRRPADRIEAGRLRGVQSLPPKGTPCGSYQWAIPLPRSAQSSRRRVPRPALSSGTRQNANHHLRWVRR